MAEETTLDWLDETWFESRNKPFLESPKKMSPKRIDPKRSGAASRKRVKWTTQMEDPRLLALFTELEGCDPFLNQL